MSSLGIHRRSTLALGIALALYGGAGVAQQQTVQLEEIVVTGSFIRGAAEQAALPVDIVTAEDLQKQGSPTIADVIKTLPSTQAVMGEANQFSAGYSLGSANVNLRGLSSARTLVLMNGRRIAPNPAVGVGVDVNLLPSAAIGRVEVLKDGAAATYGSDAVAGVVNFITRTDLQGFLVDGSYSYIDGSDGDYSANLAYGWRNDKTDLLLTAGYRHRSELPVRDRDWALRPFSENPSGGWSASGNPGTFTVGGAGARIVDPQCANLGGVPTATIGGITSSPTTNVATATGCQTQYLALDNIIEDEDHYQIFGQLNQKIGDGMEFHFEALYASHKATEHSSPSYLPTQGPTGFSATGVNSTYLIPYDPNPALSNPGYAGLLPQLTAGQVTAIQNAGGVRVGPFFGALWRPFLVSGNPLTGGAKEDVRDFDMYRFSASLTGNFTDSLGWETAVTYGETTNDAHTPDIYVARMDLALRGLGGPNCTGTTPGANGCQWLNPFSTAISKNVVTGQQSTVAPSAPNSPDLVRWLFGDFGYEISQSVLSIDAGLNGQTGLELPGGKVAWAAGAQFRQNGLTRDPVNDSDPAVMPCPQSIVDPMATCAVPTGVLSFNSPLYAYNLMQDVYAAYGELSLPIVSSLDAQLAVRYEDYGGGIGSTTNPKLALHWQPIDALSFRGSVGTTFRAPAATQVVPGLLFTGNAFVAAAGSYKPFDNYGNPNLKPEKALAFNVGTIVRLGGFVGSLDYWNFSIDDALVVESGTDLINTFFANASNCTDPAYAGLLTRFTFNTGVCGPISTLGRVRITTSNAQTIDTSGIDADFRYAFDASAIGKFTVGLVGTYNLKYELGAVFVEGIQIGTARDLVGTRGSAANSQPRWKGSLFVEYSLGVHNVRWTARHISSMHDVRAGTNLTSYAGFRDGDPGSTVDAITTHDLSYLLSLPSNMTITAAVTNVFDKDPSFARTDLSYDAFTGNPVGRVVKVGVSKKF